MTQSHRYSGTLSSAVSPREQKNAAFARKAAAAGIVLLRNTGVLPLDAAKPVALFGIGAVHTIKGGTGSGDVNNRHNVSIYQGLKEAGVPITDENWIADCDARYTTARQNWKEQILADVHNHDNPFYAYALHPFRMPEGRAIAASDTDGASAVLYVVSRIAGEGIDRRLEKGDYYLSDTERRDLLQLDRLGLPVVLLINAGGPVELTELLAQTSHISAILQLSQLGQQGGQAVADVLLGKVVPEGKLTATWAKSYYDYPAAKDFGYLNGDLEKEIYSEGIYVGYRYFDSFGIQPLFPFGFGLSYTTFSMHLTALRALSRKIGADISVQNTGDRFTGREVAQLYLSCPQDGQAKEYRRLAGFAKTKPLAPHESQTVTISIPQKQLACFSPEKNAWVICAGSYGVWAGNSSDNLTLYALIEVAQDTVIEQTHPICPVQHPFPQLGQSTIAVQRTANWQTEGLPICHFVPQPEIAPALSPVQPAQGPIEELIPLLYGNVTSNQSNLGSAGSQVPGSAGETTSSLACKGVPALIMADGPAGVRLRQSYQVDRATGAICPTGILGALENGFLDDTPPHENADTYYQYCTAFPVGTALAQSWDVGLVEEFGRAVAEEMREFSVDLWLAPGMNIQRNPLCGRNFEYFSEDPLLAGLIAAAVTRGVQQDGHCGVTIKHFACNNQEDNRHGVDARVSEKALREIYLRGFEIAVKQAAPFAVMSSYNVLNGVHTANSRDLCTVVLREEWGFDGVVMSDWNTTSPAGGSISWKCTHAGNDIIMPGLPIDEENIRAALADQQLSEEDVRTCAGRVIAVAKRLHQ